MSEQSSLWAAWVRRKGKRQPWRRVGSHSVKAQALKIALDYVQDGKISADIVVLPGGERPERGRRNRNRG